MEEITNQTPCLWCEQPVGWCSEEDQSPLCSVCSSLERWFPLIERLSRESPEFFERVMNILASSERLADYRLKNEEPVVLHGVYPMRGASLIPLERIEAAFELDPEHRRLDGKDRVGY